MIGEIDNFLLINKLILKIQILTSIKKRFGKVLSLPKKIP